MFSCCESMGSGRPTWPRRRRLGDKVSPKQGVGRFELGAACCRRLLSEAPVQLQRYQPVAVVLK